MPLKPSPAAHLAYLPFVEGFMVAGKLGRKIAGPFYSFHRRHSLISQSF